MKKIALIFGAALALGLAACDDMLPNPEPAYFPELELFNSDDLVIEAENVAPAVIDLQALAETGERAVLGKITKLENFPGTYNLVFEYEISNTDDFAKSVVVAASIDNQNIVMPSATLNTAIYDTFTHDPAQTTLYTRVAAYAVQGATKLRLGGEDHIYGQATYVVNPFTPATQLYYDYFLYYAPAGSTNFTTVQFVKATDASVYDDGRFTALVEVPAGGIDWAVAVGKATGAEEYLNPADNKLSLATEVSPVLLDETALTPYIITIDVVANTYTIAVAFDALYVPGNATSTSNFDKVLKLTTKDFVNYTGTMRLYNGFYFTSQASNDGVKFIAKDIAVAENGTLTATLEKNEETKDNALKATNGLYYLEVNVGTLAFKAQLINQISLIGGMNGWNLDDVTMNMTASSRNQVWTIKDVTFDADVDFKFCVDHAWALSYGPDRDSFIAGDDFLAVGAGSHEVVQNGGNFRINEAGVYDIQIKFDVQPNVVTITKH